MRVRGRIGVVAALGALVAAAGCTSLLGDFSINATGDGGTDATLPDSAGADDSSSDAGPDVEPDVAPPVEAGGDAPSDSGPACQPDQKLCDGGCASLTDPSVGCADPSCSPCSIPNATAACGDAGACVLAQCNTGYSDCDPNLPGCETNTGQDPAHCGSCSNACSDAGGTPSCTGGVCSSIACAPGYANCDGDAGNGCEVQTTTDVSNCGTCGHVCGNANATATCANGTCSFACAPNWGHCATSTDQSGCNVNLQSDNANCGMCGHVCGTGLICSNGTCVCSTASCNGCCASSTQCDTASVTTCGGMGSACRDCTALIQHATPVCSAGNCDYSSCSAGYVDADGNRANGCETLAPTGTPDAASLLLWLRGDDYVAGATTWADQSGHADNATCTSCPTTTTGPNGHTAVAFDGASTYMNLTGNYYSWAGGVSIWIIADAASASTAYGTLLTFSSSAGGSNYARVSLQRDATTNQNIVFQICDTGTNCPYAISSGNVGFNDAWNKVFAFYLPSSQLGEMYIDDTQNGTATLITPPSVNRQNNFIAHDLFGRYVKASVAEVIVFNTAVGGTTQSEITAYLKTKYGM